MIRTGERLRGVCGIYCAIHRDSLRCYVGSSVNIGLRFNSHMHDAGNGSRNYFHRALREFGPDAFDLEVLERCRPEELLDRESFYIALMDSVRNGFNTDPNPKNVVKAKPMSKIARARLSAAHKGRVKDAQWRAKLSASHKAIPISEATRKAALKANTGRKQSANHIEKRIACMRGKTRPHDVREKIAKGHTGKKHSEAAKAKMRAAKLGKKIPEETRKRMSEAHHLRHATQSPKPVSEDTRIKMSEAHKRYYSQNPKGPIS